MVDGSFVDGNRSGCLVDGGSGVDWRGVYWSGVDWSNVGSCCVLRFLVSGCGCGVLGLPVGRGSIRGGVVCGFSLSGFIRFVGFRHSNLKMGFYFYCSIIDKCATITSMLLRNYSNCF